MVQSQVQDSGGVAMLLVIEVVVVVVQVVKLALKGLDSNAPPPPPHFFLRGGTLGAGRCAPWGHLEMCHAMEKCGCRSPLGSIAKVRQFLVCGLGSV